jgi:hypothetical protein
MAKISTPVTITLQSTSATTLGTLINAQLDRINLPDLIDVNISSVYDGASNQFIGQITYKLHDGNANSATRKIKTGYTSTFSNTNFATFQTALNAYLLNLTPEMLIKINLTTVYDGADITYVAQVVHVNFNA